MKVLRQIKGVTWRGRIRNADIYEEFHIKPILDVIREGKFRWLGHVVRREPPSMLHEVVNYKVNGTRPRGRPRRKWQKVWITNSRRKEPEWKTWCPRICTSTDVSGEHSLSTHRNSYSYLGIGEEKLNHKVFALAADNTDLTTDFSKEKSIFAAKFCLLHRSNANLSLSPVHLLDGAHGNIDSRLIVGRLGHWTMLLQYGDLWVKHTEVVGSIMFSRI